MTSRFHLHLFMGDDDAQVQGLLDRDIVPPLIITKVVFDGLVMDLATYPMNNPLEWERIHRDAATKLGFTPLRKLAGRPALTK